MNKFKFHIPRYVDSRGIDNPWIEFETTNDLLNLEIIQKIKSNEKYFSSFVIDDHDLMIISKDGFEWRVIGYIENIDEIKLPKWEGWKFKVIINNKEAIVSKEVKSCCGDYLTLYNGTKLKILKD